MPFYVGWIFVVKEHIHIHVDETGLKNYIFSSQYFTISYPEKIRNHINLELSEERAFQDYQKIS